MRLELTSRKEFLKKYARLIAGTVIVVGIIIVFIVSLWLSQYGIVRNGTVSVTGMRDYVQEYFYEYKYLYSDPSSPWRELQITDFSNFTFFAYPSMSSISAVISTTHGAALFFDLSSKYPGEIDVSMISDPIEYYIWPQMPRNTSGLPRVVMEPGDYTLDDVVTVDHGLLHVEPGANIRCVYEDRPLNVTSNGAVEIFGTYVVQHSVFLKGSNEEEDWSKTQADIDALNEFMWDCKSAGMNTTELQRVESRYEPSMLIDRISSRMKSGVYKNNQVLFNSDYEELQKAAAGTLNDTLSKILSDYYTSQQESPPSLLDQTGSYIAQKADALVMGVLLAVLGFLATNKIKPERQKGKDN
jgi:hypothetical protein